VIAALDTNCLVRWSTNKPGDLDRTRIEHLLAQVSAAGGRVVIPAPSFAEFLVRADAATKQWIDGVTSKRSVIVAPFDRRSALECALLDRTALGAGDKKRGRLDAWQKIKIDRQIIAISRVSNVALLVTDDEGLRSEALSAGITVKRVRDLDIPQSALQTKLAFDGPSRASNAEGPAAVHPPGESGQPGAGGALRGL